METREIDEDIMTKNRLFQYYALFYIFLKASTFTFAGGLAIIPAIERDAVGKYKLLDKEEFMEYATLAQTMPGVIALNFATLVGRRAAGTLGMIAAGLGAIFPAFVIMIIATVLINLIPQEGRFIGTMRGIRAASAALVLSAAFSLGRHNIKTTFAVILMIAAFLLVVLANVSAPLIVILSAAAGCVYQHIKRSRERRHGDAA